MTNQILNQGLTTAEVEKRLAQFGLNIIEEKRKTPLIVQFLGQFKDLMVIILIAASIFAYFAGEKIDALIIIGIVLINAGIGFIQEFKAERAVEALKKMLAPRARVLRDLEEILIEAKFLVPGDIVILNEGDKVSADCELFEENEIFADESVLTGESVPVKKNTLDQKKLFMGTQITHGTGRAVVSATGMKTEFGKIARLTSETQKDKSPLQKELGAISLFVGKVTVGISALLFLIGIFIQKREVVETLIFAVSLAVAAVPEGLPATITVALALGVQRLARHNAIVKQLSSVETLGSTTVICSDKTGTLTKNEMTVQELFLGKIGDRKRSLEVSVLCNNAKLSSQDGKHIVLGDPTEGALLTYAQKEGEDDESLSKIYTKAFELPFDSKRKRMSVIAEHKETGQTVAFVKGAPDSILPLCDMDEKTREELLKHTEHMADKTLRVIALAYKALPNEKKKKYTQEEIECGLTFVGLAGMLDPPREEVKEAVKLTHKAGIRVFIITGDHGLTAHAIARDIGLVKSFGVNIVTGDMLNKMSDEKVRTLLAHGQETIFARVNPEHKLRIVDILKQMGEIVAVTGDGVNDAPALKRADIGVAMGITGTDVSKEAANMVLADDSFGTIVTATIEGRAIYENMKKFIYYIFSSNIGELFTVFAGIALGLPLPLTAVFILIINTLTDVFPALALGVEPVERSVIEKPPRKPGSKIMQWPFIRRYLISGIFIGCVTIGIFIWNLLQKGWQWGQTLETDSPIYRESATLAFVVLTLLQMVHAWNSRSETVSAFKMGFLKNRALFAAVISSTLATVAFVELPFFQKYLKTAPLTLKEWGILLMLSFSILALEEIRKIRRRGASEASAKQ